MYQFDSNVAAGCSNIMNTQILKISFILLNYSKIESPARGRAV